MKLSLFLFSSLCFAVAPDFQANYRFTNRTGEPTDGVAVYNGAIRTIPVPNFSLGCVGWELDYNAEGLSGVSINLQTNTKSWTGGLNFGPGNSWSTFSGTNSSGTLPMTSTSQGTYIGYSYYPYVAINVATFTGTGSIDAVLKCWKSINYASTGGGSGTSIAGDVTGTLAASVVAKVNGVPFTQSNIIYPCDSASASTTAYTCTTGSSISLVSGTMVIWRPDVSCANSPTLNVDGTGAKPIYSVNANGFANNAITNVCANVGGLFNAFLLEYATSPLNAWNMVGLTTPITPENCTTNGSLITQFTTSPDVYTCSANLTFLSSKLSTPSVMGTGSGSPTISGCSATIGTGSRNLAGFYTSGTTGTCAVTLTWANPSVTYTITSNCFFTDITTAIDATSTVQTGGNATTVTASGTTVSGDVIRYGCLGY